MSVKATMANILQDQMRLRGVNSLSSSEYDEIAELLIQQIRELELSLAAREIADKQKHMKRKIYVPTAGAQSWQALLADPIKHWRRGYSARTLAHCWEAVDGLPPEIGALFGVDTELLIAMPEHKVALRDAGRESQTDVFALVKSKNRTIAVAVEGKVNEPFGETLRDWYVDPSPGKRQRLAFLCDLMGVQCPPPDHVHYQLFHRTASAILEADRFEADDAAMIVHSFSPENRWFDAYAAFVELFGLIANTGQLVSKRLPNGRTLHFGWAKGDPRFLSM
ncbi:DUF6946 family protein [Bradyrhizobium sp. CCBAU 45384]|uniref:DUF6946 family protein n=1 Tax=Bradyrhizobium sp. CCBAU 45384 TaxID=858428 RepID=UPI0023068185|nr:hypothetical protein [Bradyrhizobium sp. CCBAU 45384]